MYLIDRKLKHNVFRYIFQCAMATLTIVAMLLFLNIVRHGAIIASLGASTFIVFTMPQAYHSKARPLIGGYIIGVISGLLCDLLSEHATIANLFSQPYVPVILFGGLAVGLAMFLMAITNTEHAPAAGMALALILNEWSMDTLAFIVASVLWLKLVKVIFQDHLMDFRDTPENVIDSVSSKNTYE